MASLFKHKRTTLERAEKFISTSEWSDCNLTSKLYADREPVDAISCYSPEFEPMTLFPEFKGSGWNRFNAMTMATFTPVKVGQTFGPTWATHWFKVFLIIPEQWVGKEVHFCWDCSCESLIWSDEGIPLEGMSSEVGRVNFIVSRNLKETELKQVYYIEVACNEVFGASTTGLVGPPNPHRYFSLKMADIAVFCRKIYSLMLDLECIVDIAKHLPESNPRSYQALYTANQMVNFIKVSDDYVLAAHIADKFFSQKNGESQHTIVAVGNCHIDCAWLWPYGETIRKCARSFSSAVRMMETYPEYKFACSQAQQLAWIKEYYPALFTKIKIYNEKGQFLMVGGTWVEMDGHMPSGESFIRQFLYGQQFFYECFGRRCTEFWLPDTFGYSAQLPQIAKHCGIERFLTQKLSWSLVNSFPHHNFLWEGLDGSVLLTHFPPGDSYSMKMKPEELIKTVTNLKDKGRVQKSLLLYGHGDGGGGPTEDMFLRAQRLADVDGLPKVELAKPDAFFKYLESETTNLCRWVGELYLELHNGTYTTQASIKKHNRMGEAKFHDIEFLCSILYSITRLHESYPRGALKDLWGRFLLNQFHDVLPGSIIREAVKEVNLIYEDIKQKQLQIQLVTLDKLFGSGSKDLDDVVIVNTLSWPRAEVIYLPGTQSTMAVKVPALGVSKISQFKFNPVSHEQNSTGGFVLKNCFFVAAISDKGHVTSLKLLNKPREFVKGFANQFVIFDDVPLYWDAWDVMDYHLETRQVQNKVTKPLHLVSAGPMQIVLQYNLCIGQESEAVIKIIVDACQPYILFDVGITWKESHKFLKVEFPANVLSREATYEIQFGHITRPTHRNTSWDTARFEVCGHKWADIAEHSAGLAVLNDSKYGYSAHGSVLTLSLLRSSKRPDDTADMGFHSFRYAMMPHIGSFQEAGVIEKAHELNSPLIMHHGCPTENPMVSLVSEISWFVINVPGVFITSVKRAEKEESALVVRVYEAFGRHVTAIIKSVLPVKNVVRCNGLEIGETPLAWSNGVSVNFTPFKILSMIFYLDSIDND